MKKLLIILGVISVMLSCENAPLDTTATPDGEINKIQVITADNQDANIDPETGIEIPKVVFTNTDVTFKSNTDPTQIASSKWLIPQPAARPDTGDVTDLNITEFITAEPTVQFLRDNQTQTNGERSGYFINLIETLIDGSIKRASVQVGVRETLNPAIEDLLATRGETAFLQPKALGVLGLSSTDSDTQFIWKIVDDGFFLVGDEQVTERVIDNYVGNQFSVPVVFTAVDGFSSISLQIVRNSPAPETSEVVTFIIEVFPGLLPDTGSPDKDAIKLSADGRTIKLTYSEDFGDISAISAADYLLNINTDEIADTDAKTAFENISVSNVAQDPANANVLLLTLSSAVPGILMNDVSLSFTSEDLLSASDKLIAPLDNVAVAETSFNYVLPDFASFETGWTNVLFGEVPKDIVEKSTDRSLIGSTSLLFDISEAFTGLGAQRIAEPGSATTNTPGPAESEYSLSFWAYIESTDATASVGVNLTCVGYLGIDQTLSGLPLNQWVLIQGLTTVGVHCPQGEVLRPMIRNRFGSCRVYIDALDIRLTDDGR